MARSGPVPKLDAAALTRALELRRQGRTLAAIGKVIGCSAALLSLAFKRLEDDGERLPVATTGRPRKGPRAPFATTAPRLAAAVSGHAESAEPAEKAGAARKRQEPPAARAPTNLPEPRMWFIDESPLPVDPDQALEELRLRRLPEFARLIRYFLADGNIPEFRKALDSELAVVKAIRDATPPPAPDPALDPANADARDEVRAKIADLVARQRTAMAAVGQREAG